MLKSQIKKATTTVYGKPHKCLVFPTTPEGIELLKAYLSTQFKYPYGMVLELTVTHKEHATDQWGSRWDVDYVIRTGLFSTVKDGLFRLYGTDTHINVPRNFPRLTRKYILKDIRDEGLTLHSAQATDIHFNRQFDDVTEQQRIERLQRSVEQSVLSSRHLVRQPTYAIEAPRSPTRLYGEPVGHDELHGRGWVENTLNLDQPDSEKHKAVLADITGGLKPGMKVVDGSGWKGVYGYDLPLPDLSEPTPGEIPDGVAAPEFKETFEVEIQKLKEKYPDVPEEEFRQQLGKMIKE